MSKNEGVVFMPLAFVMIALHSATYRADPVYGILSGTVRGERLEISDAFPVCHDIPTKPVAESAVALAISRLQSLGSTTKSNVIGWYCVPETSGPAQPDGCSLRIAAGMDSLSCETILVTVSKDGLANLLGGASSQIGDDVVNTRGKDFGMQWKSNLPASFKSEESVLKAVRGLADEKIVTDLMDHWEKNVADEWPSNSRLEEKIMDYVS